MDGFNGTATDSQTTGTTSYEDEEVVPEAIHILGQELVKLPTYDEAIGKLKYAYENTNWTDKEKAAQEAAKIAHILNTGYGKDNTPEFKLDSDALTLSQKLADNSLSEDAKIAAIEDWRLDAKQKIYNVDDPESIVTAIARESLIDDYAMQYRRHVVAGDTGFIMDGLARGAEAMIAPLADTADVVFQSQYGEKLRNFALEHENPNRDNDLTSTFASGVGAVAGFAVSALNPYTGLAYLGATLTSQGKQVYDTALKETGSEESAKNALALSAPGIAIGTFADRLMGGTLAKTLTGKKGFLGTLTGISAGAGGMGIQTYATGKALAAATEQEKFEATPEAIAESALVGGVIGGAVGGLRDFNLSTKERAFKRLNEQFRKAINRDEDGKPIVDPTQPTNADEFLNQFVKPKEEPPPGGMPPPDETGSTIYVSPEGKAKVGKPGERPLNADEELSGFTQAREEELDLNNVATERVLTPEQLAIKEKVDQLLTEHSRLMGEVGENEKPPITEAEIADREAHIRASIDAWGSRDPNVIGIFQKRLDDFKKQLEEYKNDPKKARLLRAKYDRILEIQMEVAELKSKVRFNEEQEKAFGAFQFGDEMRPGMGEERPGATVKQAAQMMSGRPFPGQQETPLQKVIPASTTGYTPNPIIVHLTNRLLEELVSPNSPFKVELANEVLMGTKFGYFDPAQGKVVIRRQIFKDPEQARNTMAHELGHVLDTLSRHKEIQDMLALPPSENEPVAVKLLRAGEIFNFINDIPIIQKEARTLSAMWREGWPTAKEVPPGPPPTDPAALREYNYNVYRNRNTELFADVMSAILNDPQMVRSMAPNIWRAFEAGLRNKPTLKNFWKQVQDMHQNPAKLSEFLQENWEKGRKAEAAITAKSAEEKLLAQDTLLQKLGKAATNVRERVVNAFAVARDVIDKAVNRADSFLLEELYGKLYSGPMYSTNYNILVNKKELNLIEEVKGLKLKTGENPIIAFKNLDRIKHILYDTTEEMVNIEKDPNSYKAAYNTISSEIDALIANDPNAVNPLKAKDLDVSNLSGKKLVDAIAKTHLYLTKVDRERLTNSIIKARGRNLSLIDLKAIELLGEDAFAARRYLGNPDVDPITAERELALMKNRLGDDFKKLDSLNEKHHEILFDYMYPRVKEAGIFTPKLLRRIELNKRSYVTFNALKYFEKDPHISAAVRRAVGNIDQIGDEWAATIRKIAMIGARADFQISQNAGIEIAKRSGDVIREVPPKLHFGYTKEGETKVFVDRLYETQKQLQEKNPQNSYLIQTDNGRSTLYEIENPRWAKMFRESSLEQMPLISTGLSLLEKFNRIFAERELKTALSPGFWLRSKWYDVSQESLAGGAPWYDLVGLPFHISKPFREARRLGRQYARELQRGEISPELAELIKHNGIPFHMTEEVGGYYNPDLRAENVLYELSGFKIPGEAELDIPLKINRAINKAFDAIGFGRLRKAVENDELTAKITMYLIGKNIKGMNPARAARFAREYGGTPDPYGGGSEAKSINKLFLFGRAHINGMRALYNMFKDDPKGFSMQYMYRKGLPRMLMSSAIMGPLIGAMFGEEDEKLYRKFLDKVPSFDKLSKFNIPLGFIDPTGAFRGFDVQSSEVNQNWKAAYLAMPMSRELITTDTLMSPFFKNLEDYIETGAFSAKRIAKSVTQAFQSTFTGQFAPGIMGATRVAQFLSGGNPYDYYRNRGIFPKDVEEAGTVVDKTYRYLIWSLNNTAPGIFSFNRDQQSSTEPSNPFDAIGSVPIVGSTIKAFVRESNYGDLEKYKELEQLKVERDADIRLQMGDETKKLYNDYRKTQAYVSRMGKDWAASSSPEQIRRVHILQNWHSRAYRYGFNGMRGAFDKGDDAALKSEAQKLEQSSKYIAELLD